MEYIVEVTDNALHDAEEYFLFLQQNRLELEYASRWWNGLVDALLSLESMPRRCPVIPERRQFEGDLRHLMYQSHRIVFAVTADRVSVLRVYHSARRPLPDPSDVSR